MSFRAKSSPAVGPAARLEDGLANANGTTAFHRNLGCILVLAQCFALMPVYGIARHNISQISFKWLSWRTLYSVLNLCGSATLIILSCIRFTQDNGMQFDKIDVLVFYVNALIGCMLFIRLARNWSDLSREWLSVEIFMADYSSKSNLWWRFKITTSAVMLLALVEHILSVLSRVHLSQKCLNGGMRPVETYFRYVFPQVFSLTQYHHWKAVLVEFVHILATFLWNFMDLFIMLVSAALAEKFKQINFRIAKANVKHDRFWKRIREDFNRVSQLCRTLDKSICHLVTLSFVNNLFFICAQLFKTFKPIGGTIQAVYFFYSFGFLVARTIAVSLHAAWIHDESREPLSALFSVPSHHFGNEASRMIQQIDAYSVALTGSNFFYVTRSLVLGVAGTIVTFELMLLQFGPMLMAVDMQNNRTIQCNI